MKLNFTKNMLQTYNYGNDSFKKMLQLATYFSKDDYGRNSKYRK